MSDVKKMKTSELLDELHNLQVESEKDADGNFDWDMHEEVSNELDERLKFVWWMTDDDIDSVSDGFSKRDKAIDELRDKINELEKDLKKHRHDYSKTFTGKAEY